MRLPPSESDNHQRVLRVFNFIEKWTNDERPLKVIDVGSGLGVFPARLMELAKPGQIGSLLALEPDPIAFEHLTSLNKFDAQRRTQMKLLTRVILI